MLIGNNFTNSIFLQAGIYNASFTAKQDSAIVSPSDIYLLLEPRFLVSNTHLNVSIFSLPPDTVKKLLFVSDTLGIDANFYTEMSPSGINSLSFGSHVCVSFIDKNFYDLKDIANITENGLNINVIPYVVTSFLSGELHFQGTVRIMDFVRGTPAKAISVDLGYRTKF